MGENHIFKITSTDAEETAMFPGGGGVVCQLHSSRTVAARSFRILSPDGGQISETESAVTAPPPGPGIRNQQLYTLLIKVNAALK